jgi:hypothetical protein
MSSAIAPELELTTGTTPSPDVTPKVEPKPDDATLVVEKPEATPAADTEKDAADKAAAETLTVQRDEKGKFKAKVPDTYTLTLPEKSTLDASVVERTAAIARELGLPDDATAQKVLNLVNQEAATREAAVLADHAPGGAAWTKQTEAWKAETLADTALGATPAERTAAIQRGHNVLVKYGEEHPSDKAAMAEFLDNSGLGNHPVAARLFAWLGKVAGEQKLVSPTATSLGGPKATKDVLYPKGADRTEAQIAADGQ